MYDLPELRDANEAFLGAFNALVRNAGVDPRQAPVTQICGYPLRTAYRGRFTLLGVPCYDAPGCDGPAHRSFIVVPRTSAATHVQNLRGSTFAVNSMSSNTGMNLPRRLFASLAEGRRFFNRVVLTGSHYASMAAVASGKADAAAIDCVTFGLHARYKPRTVADLRVLAHTSPSPSIPFVTPRTTDDATVGVLRRALAEFSDGPDFAPLRRALLLSRIESSCEAAYDVLLEYRDEAVALGYSQLA
jgi:ABC-type phosphate/phosphonate transport system substrate-binding protein